MVVIPMKLVPYLLLIAGIGGFFTGEDVTTCLLMTIIGGIWMYFRHAASGSSKTDEAK